MLKDRLEIVVLGLSITSSWGNGHATTYRGLVRALAARGHRVLFLERDVPWYADNRDLPAPPYCRVALYRSLEELRDRFRAAVRAADVCIVGSYVPDGIAVNQWVLETALGRRAFYDIDTPATLAALAGDRCAYLSTAQIPRFDLYLSFTGGPTLRRLERGLGARRARALYCSVDEEAYFPEELVPKWDLGYMGTYSPDRQPTVTSLLIEPARLRPGAAMVVAGPQYPDEIAWPANVARIQHIGPADHRRFYNRQRFTLNVTRAEMRAAGWSPSVRLFEAAACGVPIVSDVWPGLESLFVPNQEILLARTAQESLRALDLDEEARQRIGAAARSKVLAQHTATHRALELEIFIAETAGRASAQAAEAEVTRTF